MRPLRPALAALLVPLLAPACSAPPASSGGPAAVPVTVATAVRRDIPVEIEEVGTVEPYASVAVRTQVGGVLEKVGFREGQDVHEGDLLFRLDPRPYEAALEAARASLARDEVQLRTAQQDVERYRGLVDKEYITREEYDRLLTTVESLDAAVRADRAAVDKAELDLDYCTLRSPLTGRTGQLMVNAGNVVKANSDAPLVVIHQIDPIYVAFSVPEQNLPQIRDQLAAGALTVRTGSAPAGEDPPVGRVTFLVNAVDRSTGTVRLKATFDNGRRLLWPGQFVHVRLHLATESGAVLVPSQAVQTGQAGPYVFIVKADQTVDSRSVEPGAGVDGETVIARGIEPGETVVTDGQIRLVPGTNVTIKKGLEETPAEVAPASGDGVEPVP